MNKVIDYMKLHGCIWVYSITSVLIKLASRHPFLSGMYILYYFLMIADLGIYALLWQQVIKKFDPSVAYSNKSVTTIWTILYAHVLFAEEITIKNVIGAALIIAGIVIAARGSES